MRALLSSLAAGLLFAIGLGLAGMTDPSKVRAFLDVTGDWDPTLAAVMAGAVVTHAIARALILRLRKRPVAAPAFPDTSNNAIDRRLLAGSALFGAGWGLAGYCPGPALVSVGTAGVTVLAFVASMVAGMALFHAIERRRAAVPVKRDR